MTLRQSIIIGKNINFNFQSKVPCQFYYSFNTSGKQKLKVSEKNHNK